MSLTPTTNIPLGFVAPAFSLPDTVSGKDFSYEDLKGEKGTLVMFICNHCPFVVHIREELARLAKAYQPVGIGIVAISSNDVVNYPQDGPKQMAALAKALDFTFPYLFDESQDVAKAYDAACTPDFSVFDKDQRCVYRGQLDDSRPGNGVPVTGKDLRAVLDALVEGHPIPGNHQPSVGCNIKWKKA